MAVQQLGRDQARTLTDIIRGVSNVGGGIDEALQVVPGLGSATPKNKKPSFNAPSPEFFPPGAGPLAFSELGQIGEAGYVEDQTRGKPSDYSGGVVGGFRDIIDSIAGSVSKAYPRVTLSPDTGPSFVKPEIGSMSIFERSQMEADERDGIDDQLRNISQSLRQNENFVKPEIPVMTEEERIEMEQDEVGSDKKTTTSDSEFQSGVKGTPEFGVDNVPTKEEQDDILEETFSKSMKDYLDALKGEDTDVKSIEEYKKEFADATGISIDGKPDKSAALMSFGLALMQNKAGKGFNIGRMLSAVGEAGEKAMPAFQQAKKEAKAEQLAAGKYALDSRAAALTKAASTRQALADRVAELSDRAYDRDTQLQVENLKQDGQNLRKEAELLATAQRKAVEDAEKAGELGKATKLLVGGFDKNKFEVQGQQVGTSDVFKIINAKGAMRTVDGMIKGSSKGLETAQRMKEIAASGEISGYKDLFNRFQLGAQGLFSTPFDGKVDNATAEYKAAVGSMLTQFRKLLTGGEAGNAISDRDVEIIEKNLGYLNDALLGNLTTSSEEIIARIDNLEGMFQERLDMHSAFKTNLIEIGQKAGQYQKYDLGDDSNFTDDFEGYSLKVMPNGRVRYSLVDKG